MTNEELIEYLEGLGFKDSQTSNPKRPESFIYHYSNDEEVISEVEYHDYYKAYYINYLVKVIEDGEELRITTSIDGIYTPEKCKELVERHKHFIFS